MERHKRFGIIAITASIILAIASLVFSENPCSGGSGSPSWLDLLLVCLRVNVYEETPGYILTDHIYLQTKYLLLACAVLLAVGVLWHKGAIPVPGGAEAAKPLKPSEGNIGNDT